MELTRVGMWRVLVLAIDHRMFLLGLGKLVLHFLCYFLSSTHSSSRIEFPPFPGVTTVISPPPLL